MCGIFEYVPFAHVLRHLLAWRGSYGKIFQVPLVLIINPSIAFITLDTDFLNESLRLAGTIIMSAME